MAAIDSDIVLRVPARTASLQLIRTVAASAGARFGLSIDDIEDLRIAVTEAGAELIDRAARGAGGGVTLRIAEDSDALNVSLTVDDEPRRGAADGERAPSQPGSGLGPDTEDSLAWQVLLALVDDLRFVFDDGVGLAFSKHRLDGHGA